MSDAEERERLRAGFERLLAEADGNGLAQEDRDAALACLSTPEEPAPGKCQETD